MALNDPPQRETIEHDERDDASDTDADAKYDVEDGKPLTPFCNPPISHPLSYKQYDSLEDLEFDLYNFTASVSFYVVKKRANNFNKALGFNTNVDFVCQRGAG